MTARRKGNGKIEILEHKAVTAADDFMHSKTTEDMMDRPLVVAGHCRHATVGHINKQNAHPLLEGRFLGMHNGTIHSYHITDKENNSDSRELYRRMDKDGVDSAIKSAWHGAWALCWINLNDKNNKRTLNFARNDGRPLHWVERNSVVYWASEEMFLEFMLARSTLSSKDCEVRAFPKHTHISFDIGGTLKPRVTELQAPIVPVYDYKRKFSPPYVETGQEHEKPLVVEWKPPEHSGRKPMTVNEVLQKRKEAGIDELTNYIGYANEEWTKADAEKKLKGGCTNCRCERTTEDAVYWSSDSDWFCADCIELPIVRMHVKALYRGGMADKLEQENNVECG